MIPEDDLIVLDTNIVLAYVRANVLGKYIENTFELRKRTERPAISIVTIGEMLSLAKRLNWGDAKVESLSELLSEFVVVDISDSAILKRYSEIDAYTQALKPARKMGKNDLWIGAVSSTLGAHLISTDNDFVPLNGSFINLVLIDPASR